MKRVSMAMPSRFTINEGEPGFRNSIAKSASMRKEKAMDRNNRKNCSKDFTSLHIASKQPSDQA